MAKRKPRKNSSVKNHLEKVFLGLTLLVAIVMAAAVAAHFIFKKPASPPVTPKQVVEHKAPAARRPSATPPVPEKLKAEKKEVVKKPPTAVTPREAPKAPQYEIYPKEDHLPPLRPKVKPAPEGLPLVAIIIDDMGYDQELANDFLSLDAMLTFSIFPHSPHGTEIAHRAHAKGYGVMLHLPMEPNEYPAANPGPGALLTTMTPDELITTLRQNLNDVPFISGVNNHMGSKMTANDAQMNQIFIILKRRNLFFVDSRTTVATLTRHSAALFKVPWAERNVFLDHHADEAFVRKQFKLLVTTAKRQGEAVGIGHPHHITYQILRELLPDLKQNVKLVRAGDVVRIVD